MALNQRQLHYEQQTLENLELNFFHLNWDPNNLEQKYLRNTQSTLIYLKTTDRYCWFGCAANWTQPATDIAAPADLFEDGVAAHHRGDPRPQSGATSCGRR
jgi:hypothetical protein